jgi:hypothetical protein
LSVVLIYRNCRRVNYLLYSTSIQSNLLSFYCEVSAAEAKTSERIFLLWYRYLEAIRDFLSLISEQIIEVMVTLPKLKLPRGDF